ncbi:MAG TPA: hypothetical protein VMW87_01250 [Spirochaetia bacterium]|nr:hypothetical protein [Spirochaetia bacterium]
MLDLHPHLYQEGKELIVIRYPRGFRLIFAGIAGLFLWGMVGGNLFEPIFVVMVAILMIAALYNDRWVLDRKRQVAEYHLGVLPLFRRKIIPFDTITRLEYREFARTRHSPGRARRFERPPSDDEDPASRWKAERVLSRITLVTNSGHRYGIEVVSFDPAGLTGTTAKNIASFMSKELVELS